MSFAIHESSRYSGRPVTLFLIQGALTGSEAIGPFAYTDGEEEIVRPVLDENGDPQDITFIPWPIEHGPISQDGTLDKSDVSIAAALGTPIDDLFIAYPPSQVVNLTIFEGHTDDEVTEANYPAVWLGRIASAAFEGNEIKLSCVPVSTRIRMPGLRRNYQVGCPHVLYGEQCGANKAAATVTRTVVSVNRNNITIDSNLGSFGQYVGGLLEWVNSDTGRTEIRTISSATALILTIRGLSRGIGPDTEVSIVRGCDHQMTGCNLHDNIQNYGGQPFIPLDNPLAQKNMFY